MPCPIISKIRKIIPKARWVTHLPIISKRQSTLASAPSKKVTDGPVHIPLREPICTPIEMTSETRIELAAEVTQQDKDDLVRAIETNKTELEGNTGLNEKATAVRKLEIVGLDMADQVFTPNSSLESLPAELRRHIISMVELGSLQSLIHASPGYCRQYLAERRLLLSRSLESTLGSVTVEAYAVHLSNSADFARERNAECIEEFLKFYHTLKCKDLSSPLRKVLSMEDIISMVKFHCQIVQPLVRRFATQASNKLREHTESFHIHDGLSRTEEIRMVRAFYRYQLCCNIYGCGHGKSFASDKSSYSNCVDKLFCSYQSCCFRADYSSSGRVLKDFFCLFDPWEVEEIVCVSKFSQAKYEGIFDEIKWDVDEENPKFDEQRPPTPVGAFDLRKFSLDRAVYLTTLTSRGLELLHTVLFRIKDHAQLVSTMSTCMTRCVGSFLHDSDSSFDEYNQWNRHCDEPGERDHKQGHREPLIFQGDRQDGAFPPLAWTLVWEGTYSNIFGDYILENFQEWGWVIWDADRLEITGAKELLMRQWQEMKEASYYDDPRQPFWYKGWLPR